MIELSTQALATCRRHYQGGKGCGRCPIQRPCSAPHPWGQEGIDRWRERINKAAEAGRRE